MVIVWGKLWTNDRVSSGLPLLSVLLTSFVHGKREVGPIWTFPIIFGSTPIKCGSPPINYVTNPNVVVLIKLIGNVHIVANTLG